MWAWRLALTCWVFLVQRVGTVTPLVSRSWDSKWSFIWTSLPTPSPRPQELRVLLNFLVADPHLRSPLSFCAMQEVGHLRLPPQELRGKTRSWLTSGPFPVGTYSFQVIFLEGMDSLSLPAGNSCPCVILVRHIGEVGSFWWEWGKVATGCACLLSRDGTCFCTELLLPGCSGWPQIPACSLPSVCFCFFFN